MKIAVVGSYGVGMTMRLQRVPGPGETLSGGEFSAGPGGKGSNQAIGAARLGAQVSFLTCIGDDVLAEEARSLWNRENVDATHVIVGSQPTMVGFILVEDSGENRIIIASGALRELTPEHVETFRETMAQADMVVVSMEIPTDAVVAALRIAKEEGTLTLLNPAPASPLPPEAWNWIDVLTPNQSEGQILLGLDADHGLANLEVVSALRERTNAKIVLTLGAGGSLLDDNSSVATVSAFPVQQVVDTTGAGDSFTAALAVALCEGLSFAESVEFASAAGAHTVTVPGVIDALPTRANLASWTRVDQ